MSHGVFGLTSFAIGMLVVVNAGIWASTIALCVHKVKKLATVVGIATFIMTVTLIITWWTTTGVWDEALILVIVGGLVALAISALPLIAALDTDSPENS